MPLGLAHQDSLRPLKPSHDTSAQAPTSCSLSVPCPNAVSVKPIAMMMPRHNCFIVPSTQVQSRAVKHAQSNTFFQVHMPAAGLPPLPADGTLTAVLPR